MNMKAKEIRNLKICDGGAVSWDVVYFDEILEETKVVSYRTDDSREGIFIDSDFWYTKQKEGTSDFQLKQKTRAGIVQALKRYFEID